MKKTNLLVAGFAAAAAFAMAVPASATVTTTFLIKPAHSPSAGFSVVEDFNTPTPGTCALNVFFCTARANWSGLAKTSLRSLDDPFGTPPSNAVPFGTPYFDIGGLGTATYTFASAVSAFEFDWGSLDTFNKIVIHTTGGDKTVLGSSIPPATGSHTSPLTNGLFLAASDSKTPDILGFTLSSGGYAYEIDNIAVKAVPEPATWALMFLGFGGVGAMMRRRRQAAQFA